MKQIVFFSGFIYLQYYFLRDLYLLAVNFVGDYFIYCSTLAIYIVRLSDFSVHQIIACHEQAITSISGSPQSSVLLASSGLDGLINIWNIEKEDSQIKISLPSIALQIEWSPLDENIILALLENGDIRIVDIKTTKTEKIMNLDASKPKLIRWNPNSLNKFAVGCDDGKLIIHTYKKSKTSKIQLKKVSIEELQWDLASDNYLLIGWSDGSMSLLDIETEQEMQQFDRQGTGINCIQWIKGIPGGFLTTNSKVTSIKVWNVSNKSPITTIKLGVSAVLNIASLSPKHNNGQSYIVSFKNGSVGIFNYQNKKLEYVSDLSHSETVFDVQFKPSDKNILATSSYDGSIKIWNVLTMKNIGVLKKQIQQTENQYISWAPGKDSKIACVNSFGELLIWDTDKYKLICEILPGGHSPIQRVDWNQLNPSLLASGSSENNCIVYEFDKQKNKIKIRSTIKHPDIVFGVSWDPFKSNQLATGCFDGIVRIFDVTGTVQLVQQLSGHQSKVYNVEWNRLIPAVLASGSDDKTIKVWNLKQVQKCITLIGHTNNVRGLSWNSEIPWILVSGAWDATIRMWDVRSAQCLHVATEHHADVYGLAYHPDRPFIYVSTSRDTSIRYWSLERLIQQIIFSAFVDKSITKYVKDVAPPQLQDYQDIQLYGKASNQLVDSLKSSQSQIEFYEKILKFFTLNDNQDDFWDIIHVIKENKSSDLSNDIIYINDLTSAYMSKAQELEQKGQGGFSYDVMNKKSDRLIEAANIYLRLGEFQCYCECLVKLGKWESAIAFAPSVSYEYWQNLTEKYANYLQEEQLEESTSYLLLSNQIDKAVTDLIEKGEFQEAKILAIVNSQGKFENISSISQNQEVQQQQQQIALDDSLSEIIQQISENYLQKGKPLTSAANHLAVNDVEGAINKLIRSNELFYAYALSQIFESQIQKSTQLLAKRGERIAIKDQLFEFLNNNNLKEILPFFILNNSDNNTDLISNNLKKYNLPSIQQYLQLAKDAESKSKLYDAVKHYILGKETIKAINLAIEYMKNTISNNNEVEFDKIYNMIQYFSYAQIYSQTDKKIIGVFHAYCFYIGIKKGISDGCISIVNYMIQILEKLIQNYNIAKELPFKVEGLKIEYIKVVALYNSEQYLKELYNLQKNPNLSQKEIDSLTEFLNNLKNSSLTHQQKSQLEFQANKNKYYLVGNNLPFNAMQRVSYMSDVSKTPIRADGYSFEDSKTYANLEEALIWSYLCPFTPLITGCSMNPY